MQTPQYPVWRRAAQYDPMHLAANITGTSAALTWDASTTPGVVDYAVFHRTPSTGAPFNPRVDTPVASGITGTSYNDTGLSVADYDWQVFGRITS